MYQEHYPFDDIQNDVYLGQEAKRLQDLLKEKDYSQIISKKRKLLDKHGIPYAPLMLALEYSQQGQEVPEHILKEFITGRDRESLQLLNEAINKIGEGLKPLLDILKSSLGSLGEFFYSVLSIYFLKLNDHEKLWVNAGVLRSPELHKDDVDFEKEFPICLMRVGGPYYHKICQLIAFAGRGSGNDALKTFESALNGLNPLSNNYLYDIKVQVEENNPKLKGIRFIKTLGKASIGVAFLAKSKDVNFVIKIIRPDLTSRCKRDREIFIKIAQDTNINALSSVRPIMDSIDQELSFDEEMDNMEKGRVYRKYRSLTDGPSIQICNVIQKERGVPYLIQSIAPGETVNAWINKEFSFTLLSRLYDLSYVWFWEAIPGKGGACHCDLHAGNMLFDYNSKAITVIDFGNFTTFNDVQKKSIFRMMLSTVTGDWKEFLNNFNNLLPQRVDLPQELLNRAYKSCSESKHGRTSQIEAIQQILNKALSLNVSVPEPIIKFARTATMLEGATSSVINNGLKKYPNNENAQQRIKNYSFEMAIARAIEKMLDQSKLKIISMAGVGNCYRMVKPKDFAPPINYVDPDVF